MSDKLIAFSTLMVMLVCTGIVTDILFRWIYELFHLKETTFIIEPRGTGEANAARGWK